MMVMIMDIFHKGRMLSWLNRTGQFIKVGNI